MIALRFVGLFVGMVTCVTALSDVMDLLTQQPEATTAVSLIKQAGLDAMLHSGGPFTLIVPTDAAFANVPANDLAALKADPAMLKNTLQFHVLPGMHFTWDLRVHEFLNTSNNHSIRVYADSEHTQLFFNQAKLVRGELQATNGVIYLVDEVLNLPEGTVFSILHNPDYNTSIFYGLAQKLHMSALFDNMNYQTTVFVPTNAAFLSLPANLQQLINSSSSYARYIVDYHTHRGIMHASSLSNDGSITTIHSGHTIHVTHDPDSGDILLNKVGHVQIADIEADNGVVHVISHVLIPSNLAPVVG